MKTYACDIRDAHGVEAIVQAIWDEGGPLTGLVNDAAGNFISRTEDLSPRGFDAIADIVLHGTFYVTHGRPTLDCGTRENDRQARRALGPLQAVEPASSRPSTSLYIKSSAESA